VKKSKPAAKVLILSAPTDLHALTVGEHLDQLGVSYKIWRGEDLLKSCKLNFAIADEDVPTTITLADGDAVELSELTSIWFRRPGSPRSVTMPEPWIERMMEQEAVSVMGGMLRSAPCLLVNHPGRDADCLFKIWQLEAAKRVGLSIPDTIVTNDPETAKEFVGRHDEKIIYKFIGETANRCFPASEMAIGIPTVKFRERDVNFLDLFQKCVEKNFEVRVTAIGKKLFAGKIESQSVSSVGKTDWRLDYSVPMEDYELPDEVADSCLNLLRTLGLNYGAIDFCVDHDGRHVFLECNCAGQFLWLEKRTTLPLSLELAKLLAGMGDPVVPPSIGNAIGQDA
jgi:hypothetical protein